MQKLVQGIHHFQNQVFSSNKDLFEHLTNGQHPDALFITCSDSRINPNLITNTEAGDLVPPHGPYTGGEAATVEFAVAALGVEDIIVCGHSHCGAIKGMLHTEK